MSLLRSALKLSGLHRIVKLNQGLPSLLRQSPRSFSTYDEQPLPPPPQTPPAEDPFLQTPSSELTFGNLTGITKYTLKTDIVKLFDECNLNLDDVKFGYDRFYMPSYVFLRFLSPYAFGTAYRTVPKKGRLHRLDRIDHATWDTLSPYDGKYLLLEGVPRNALVEDVERFLAGHEFDPSSISLFSRQADKLNIRLATVRFSSQIEAMNAAITKNRRFCLSNQVSVRVLQ